MQAWIATLKADCASNMNPTASDVLWNSFRRRFNSESLKLKDLCYSHVYDKFTEYLNALKPYLEDIWLEKPILHLDISPCKPP